MRFDANIKTSYKKVKTSKEACRIIVQEENRESYALQELIADLRRLQLAIRLPLTLYEDGIDVFSEPESFAVLSTGRAAKRPLAMLPIAKGHPHTPQHLKSPYAERYICIELDERYTILIGPYLYPDDEETIERMVRRGLYDIADIEQAGESREQLPHIPYRSAIAIGRLAAERCTARQERGEYPYGINRNSAEVKREAPMSALMTPLPENYYRIQVEERSGQFAHPSIRLEDALGKRIEAGDTSGALSILRRINRLDRAKLADNPLRSLKNSLIGSMTIFTRAAIQGGVPDNQSFTLSDAYIRQIESATGQEELEGIEERAIRSFINLVNEEKKQKYSHVIGQLMQYIDTNLTSELSLNELAGIAHMHPNYLSSRFHKETGTRLSAYIRDKRLEEAIHMIQFSNNSLKQIAAFYRFSSQSHFSRAFKEKYGMTPSDVAKGRRKSER